MLARIRKHCASPIPNIAVYSLPLGIFALIAAILLSVTPAQAAPGINEAINFQGRVTNTDGTNVTDGAYDFVFKIYNGAGSGASTLFTETWSSGSLFTSTMNSAPASAGESLTYSSNTNESSLKAGQILWNTTKKESVKITSVNTGTNVIGISPTRQAWSTSDTITNRIYVKSGLFTVAINSLNKDFSGVDFNSDSIYLGITFNNDGEMKPRIQFASVPYALNSQKVNGVTVTNTSGGTPTTGTTIKIADGKTVAFNGGLTFAGTDGKTLTVNNTLTFGATDGSTVNFGSGGTVCYQGTCSASLTDDSLDFDKLKDSLTLDAATDIALGGFNLSTSGSGAIQLANTGGVAIAGNLSVGADKTIKLTGGTAFPGSPTEGEMFYRTDTGQLYIYTGSKWQADRSTATKIVAASNSANKEKADYAADGTDDQVEINQAITDVAAAGGGVVYLLEGTFTVSDNISLDNNITFSGSGWGTVIKFANNTVLNNAGMVRAVGNINTYKSNISFENMQLDGNKANQADAANKYGLYSAYIDRLTVRNVYIHDFNRYGFDPHEVSRYMILTENVAENNGDASNNYDGFTIDYCEYCTVSNNISRGNQRHGINVVTTTRYSTIANNVSEGNLGNGITINDSHETVVSGNISRDNAQSGIYLQDATNNLVQNNTVSTNQQHGIKLSASSFNTISNNKLLNNSQEADNTYTDIMLDDDGGTGYSTYNTVNGNDIRADATNKTKFGIREDAAVNDYNTIMNNVIHGPVSGNYSVQGPHSSVSATSGRNFGLQITDPTALLHLGAGGSAAGTAALKLETGSLLATPENGAIEFDGSDLYYTAGTTRRTVVSTDASQQLTNKSIGGSGLVFAASGGAGSSSTTLSFANGDGQTSEIKLQSNGTLRFDSSGSTEITSKDSSTGTNTIKFYKSSTSNRPGDMQLRVYGRGTGNQYVDVFHDGSLGYVWTGAGNLSLQAAGGGTSAAIQIGSGGAGSTTPDVLGLDVKSSSGDPTGFAGAMYYNGSDNKFRCYQNSGWTDCITAGLSITDDSLDFDKLKDSLTLDANTSITLNSNTLSTTGFGVVSFGHTGATVFSTSPTINNSGTKISYSDTGSGLQIENTGSGCTSSSVCDWYFIATNSGFSAGTDKLVINNSFSTTSPILTMDGSNGRVGIGNNAPGVALDVAGGGQFDAGSTSLIAKLISSNNNARFDLQNTSSGGLTWTMFSTGSGSGAGAGKLLFTPAASTSSSNIPLALSSGGVGIFTNNPQRALDVVGNMSLRQTTGGARWTISTLDDSYGTINGCDSGSTGSGYSILCIDNSESAGSEFKISKDYVVYTGTTNASGNPDVAEYIRVDDTTIDPGTILTAADPSSFSSPNMYERSLTSRSTAPYQPSVVGIVSTSPGLLFGIPDVNSSDFNVDGDRWRYGDHRALALAGRVPVKVSTINGTIAAGDPITSSAIAGFGMKATQSGTIVAKALQPYDGIPNSQVESIACPAGTPAEVKCAKIMAFVNVSWFQAQGDTDPNPGVLTRQYDKAYPAQSLPAGSVVSINGSQVSKSLRGSSNLAVVANPDTRLSGSAGVTVGLSGQMSVIVSDEQGAINVGDKLGTQSLYQGVAASLTDQDSASLGEATTSASFTQCTPADSLDAIDWNTATNTQCFALASGHNVTRIKALIRPVALGIQTTSSGALTDAQHSVLDVLSVADGTLTSRVNMNIIGNLSVSGGLTLGGPAEFKGPAMFRAVAEFFDTVIFRKPVKFADHVQVAADTAGVISIAAGESSASVTFANAYANAPVVNMTRTLPDFTDEVYESLHQAGNECETLDKPACRSQWETWQLGINVEPVITSRTAEGFTISLSQPAATDLYFSWSALAVAGTP